MRKLLILILSTLVVGFGFGFGVGHQFKPVTQYGNTIVNNAGFTDGEMQLMQQEVPLIESALPITNVTVKPISIVEVNGDRLALFEADGTYTGKPIKLILYIEHYGIYPDSVGGANDNSGQPLGVIPGKYDTTGAQSNGG